MPFDKSTNLTSLTQSVRTGLFIALNLSKTEIISRVASSINPILFLIASSGNEFEKEFEFSLGSISLGMAELVINIAGTDEPIDEILSEINNVQVGVYNRQSSDKIKTDFSELKIVTQKMESAGWDCMVRTIDRNEMTAVFVRFSEDELNQLFVISVSNDEVVIAEILGNLNKVIEVAIREKGLDFAMNH